MTLRSTPDNVPENVLPPGLKEAAVIDAIVASGYPLQGHVAASLLGDFGVVEEWDYIDDESAVHRNLDIMAWRRLAPAGDRPLTPELRLLIECKKSRQPYVFFRSVTNHIAPRFPAVAGLSRDLLSVSTPDGKIISEIHPVELLCLKTESFVSAAPTCSVMSRAYPKGDKVDLSGSEAHSDLILPLTKAIRHLQTQLRPEREPWRPAVVLALAVLDAPMLLIESPSHAGDPCFCPWIRIMRREPQETFRTPTSRFYGVDVVHREYLPRFLQDHVMPFAELFAARCKEKPRVLSGRATVPSFDRWSWHEVLEDSRRSQ